MGRCWGWGVGGGGKPCACLVGATWDSIDLVNVIQGWYIYIYIYIGRVVVIVQELCESRGGRPGLSVLTSLLVSVDVKLY